ncbi:hypothetical protein [Crocosphaera sp.]|uniref:hypothetical protein n=1 Tax=Crocosphaera sp. TaxID=2729996 RepID=UPI00261A7DCD|nr:hypothetical protein [Crocosphaera sp.]MDJ0583372.1 hypothetical protein [Crocosphaera sp.]
MSRTIIPYLAWIAHQISEICQKLPLPVNYLTKIPGGWEGWLQVQMYSSFDQGNNQNGLYSNIQREENLYYSNSLRADLTLWHNQFPPTVIEIKVETRSQIDPSKLKQALIKDAGKLLTVNIKEPYNIMQVLVGCKNVIKVAKTLKGPTDEQMKTAIKQLLPNGTQTIPLLISNRIPRLNNYFEKCLHPVSFFDDTGNFSLLIYAKKIGDGDVDCIVNNNDRQNDEDDTIEMIDGDDEKRSLSWRSSRADSCSIGYHK